MERRRVAAVVFLQMLPATLVAPAVRPLFAAFHHGNESAMHSFMALNMLGAIVGVPVVQRFAARKTGAWLSALVLLDAALLVAVAAPLPTWCVLALRALEGAAHVGTATLLFSEAARLRQERGDTRAVPLAGAALMFAIMLGSALGGVLARHDPRAPFWCAAVLLAAIAPVIRARGAIAPAASETVARPRWRALARTLWIPVGSAFVGRFTVGCLVVTFSLFAHRIHRLDDAAVGVLFSLLTGSFAFGMYPAGQIAEASSRAAMLAAGLAIYALALAGIPLGSTNVMKVLMPVAGLASAMIFSPTLCYSAALVSSEHRRHAIALVNIAGSLGMLLGPAAAGILSAWVRHHVPPDDVAAPYRAAFMLAAASVTVWLVVTLRWLAPATVRELRERANAAHR